MSPLLAHLAIGAALLPFLGFAIRDQVLHFTARRVPVIENIIHLILGLLLVHAVSRAFRFDARGVVLGMLAFVAAGALDELVYHRGIPERESDTHAKEHFALLAFVVVTLAVIEVVR